MVKKLIFSLIQFNCYLIKIMNNDNIIEYVEFNNLTSYEQTKGKKCNLWKSKDAFHICTAP